LESPQHTIQETDDVNVRVTWSRLRTFIASVDVAAAARLIMLCGTLLLVAYFLLAMLKQPFESVDDLIWLTKLRKQSFAELPFSAAWMVNSGFYRPVAEIGLKALYSICGLDLTAYRFIQFGFFIILIGVSLIVVRRLGLASESVLLLTVFMMGSPFLFGSIVWLAELPHVLVLICFVAGLAALLSERSISVKLALCGLAYAIAVLSKEQGLGLLVFYLYFLRRAPMRATIVFLGITIAVFWLRSLALGPSMGISGNFESVGYFFEYLSTERRRELFSGNRAYLIYAYNIAAQFVALTTRATQWGVIFDKLQYQTVLQTASTAVIIAGAVAWKKNHKKPAAILLVLAATVLGGTTFSFTYARDRHLALAAMAYGFLLVIALGEIGAYWRSRNVVTAMLFGVWLAWSAQAYWAARYVRAASLEVIEKIYQPSVQSPSPIIDPDIWTTARDQALALRKP
jgi:hypothetical protein